MKTKRDKSMFPRFITLCPLEISFLKDELERHPICLWDVGCLGGIDEDFHSLRHQGVDKTYAIDPNPSAFKELERDSSIEKIHCALSHEDGTGDFVIYKNIRQGTSHLLDRSIHFTDPPQNAHKIEKEVIQVKVRTIESLIKQDGLKSPDILKVDAEGHDFNVIQGARTALDRLVLVKAEVDWRVKSAGAAEIHQLLLENGFLLVGQSYNEDFLGFIMNGDVMYIRSLDSIMQSLCSDKEKREQIIKLLVVAIQMRLLNYAMFVAVRSNQCGIMNKDELESLRLGLEKNIYIPSLVKTKTRWRLILGQILYVLSVIVAGDRIARTKAFPKINQLRKFRIFYGKSKLLSKVSLGFRRTSMTERCRSPDRARVQMPSVENNG